MLDSGASDHIVNKTEVFTSMVELETPLKISVAKCGATITATKKGVIQVTTDQGLEGSIQDVLYCPELTCNLLSVKRLQERGMVVIFNHAGVEIKRKGQLIAKGKPINNLLGITFTIKRKSANIAEIKNNYKLWHERLGHISKDKFIQIQTNKLVSDFPLIVNIKPLSQICESCVLGKQTRLPF